MKKGFIILLISILYLGSCAQSQPKNKQLQEKQLQEFSTAFSSANIKLRGKLLLFGEYKGDLSKLTYDRYLELLKENENTSNKGIVELIKGSDKHAFAVKNNSFIIAIYSKRLNAVLYDDANTSSTDLIDTISINGKVPDLNELIKYYNNTQKQN